MTEIRSQPIPRADQLGHTHFIGIGGAGMSGIARIMLMRGMAVSGSDARESLAVTVLRAQGARVAIGHDAANVRGAQTVVVSSAIREANPELAAARAAGMRVLHRSQALASLMIDRRAVAVAGTHGKTTTTSMVTVALQHCGIDPSFAIGGVLTASGANSHDGTGDVFVAEADESDGSFLLYAPRIGVVTNVEADHLDHYGTAAAVEEAFDQFCDKVAAQPGGTMVMCADDEGSLRVAQRAIERGIAVVLYGTSADANLRLDNLDVTGPGASFSLVADGLRLGEVRLKQPGKYNALNAAAAFAVARLLDQPVDKIIAGLEGFGGTRRRFELRGEARGVRVFDDYAHHPTEVDAVLTAAKAVAGDVHRVIAVFQPHLYSRTTDFKHEFARALSKADEVVVMDVYPAREDPVPGVTGALIADLVELPTEHVHYVESLADVADTVAPLARAGDIVLTLGAGDVTVLGPEIVAALGASDPE